MEENITHKDLIDIETIPKCEWNKYLNFFSEGSQELRKLLKTLWDKGIYTSACCKGHNLIEKSYYYEDEEYCFMDVYAYITTKPENYILEYLSKEILLDPYIEIDRDSTLRDSIYIFGRSKLDKINKIIEDIKSGKKNNEELIEMMNHKSISSRIKHNVYRDYYYDNNFYFEEIKRIEEIIEDFNYGYLSEEEKETLSTEYNNILVGIKRRNLRKEK